MKRFWPLLSLIFLSFVGQAQTISDSFLEKRQAYWAYLNLSAKKSTSSQDTVPFKDNEKNEYALLQKIFKKYRRKKHVDLDTAKTLYILESRPGGYVIWNYTDTICAENAHFVKYQIKMLKKVKIMNFETASFYKNKDNILKVMDLVSRTEEKDLDSTIKAKTTNKDGTYRMTLGGVDYDFFSFRLRNGKYEVKNFRFRNPKID